MSLMVVAWRIARLMRLRTYPDLSAALLFERDEWQVAFILNRKKVPEASPRLNEVVRLVTMLGSFLARKGNGEPGVKTLWLGLQRVVDFAAGIRIARAAHELRVVCNGMALNARYCQAAAETIIGSWHGHRLRQSRKPP